jgi:hypothetical protein
MCGRASLVPVAVAGPVYRHGERERELRHDDRGEKSSEMEAPPAEKSVAE